MVVRRSYIGKTVWPVHEDYKHLIGQITGIKDDHTYNVKILAGSGEEIGTIANWWAGSIELYPGNPEIYSAYEPPPGKVRIRRKAIW